MDATRARNVVLGAGGILIGAILLWLAVRNFDMAQFNRTLENLNGWWICLACAVYWGGMGLRTSRWHGFLGDLTRVSWGSTAETLVVGYGANNLLPARLGELVRADYGKSRLGLHRSQLLGTIVIERLLDLTSVLVCLFAGLALGVPGRHAGFDAAVEGISRNGLALVVVIWLVLTLVRRHRPVEGAGGAARVLRELLAGIASFNFRTGARGLTLSALIWCAESITLWSVFQALQVSLTTSQTLILLGVSSLSTLVPTAPGYIGSFQLVFVLAMSAFGIPETIGLVASMSIQIFVFGSVTLAAMVCFVFRWWTERSGKGSRMHVQNREKAAHG